MLLLLPAVAAAERSGQQVVDSVCAACHATGEQGAPRIGDRVAWIPRMRLGLEVLQQSAMQGHGAMPARGGMAGLSDAELRSAIVYMFNEGVVLPAPSLAARTTPVVDPFHRVVDGTDVYLGVMPAESISPAARPSKAPGGKNVHHVNISLIDSKTLMPVTDAQVKVRVADPLGGETKPLEVIKANNAVSYGGWFRMPNKNAYTITARIQRPGAAVSEARFDYKAR